MFSKPLVLYVIYYTLIIPVMIIPACHAGHRGSIPAREIFPISTGDKKNSHF